MKITTSNKNKIKEIKAFMPEIEIVSGEDIKEVQGTIEEVIVYKAISAGKDFIVEDTILKINGEEVVDIRWKVDELKEGDIVEWITSLGYNDGEKIHVYEGKIEGYITTGKNLEGFAFDPYFIPKELYNLKEDDDNFLLNNKTLTELTELGLKHLYSARINALTQLKEKNIKNTFNINEIPVWTGSYQNQ